MLMKDMLDLSHYYQDIEAACQRFDVKRLEVFGSGAREDFVSESDVDLLVEFNQLYSKGISDRYFGLLDELISIFKRPVDLVEVSAIQNPYFKKSIENGKRVVYEQ